ncbi:hypothetical protein evm_012315 [Chilo suppressalis]|nr:hypothetical protein evm_012315 [Chilo suppressalis]
MSKFSVAPVASVAHSSTSARTTKPQQHTPVAELRDEELQAKIKELKSAKLTYGPTEVNKTVVLANGVEMPALAIGTALLDPKLTVHIVSAAIDLGYRAIDTAYIYGNEKEVGEAIRNKIEDGTIRREDLFVISKLWSTFHRTELVASACRRSLDVLGLDYVDLFLIHNPMSFKIHLFVALSVNGMLCPLTRSLPLTTWDPLKEARRSNMKAGKVQTNLFHHCGAQAFPMDEIERLGHDSPRRPSAGLQMQPGPTA